MNNSNRLTRIVSMISTLNLAPLAYSLWARWKGLDFNGESVESLGLDSARSNMHAHGGGPVLNRVLSDVVRGQNAIDLGSGKGLSTFTMAKHFQSVVGVELSSRLVEIAKQNQRKLGIENVKFICADAGKFTDFDEIDVVYMYNPFPAVVVAEVMGNLVASIKRAPRRVKIIYRAPYFAAQVEAAGFRKVKEFNPPHAHPVWVYEIVSH